jgi:hypothetical protein
LKKYSDIRRIFLLLYIALYDHNEIFSLSATDFPKEFPKLASLSWKENGFLYIYIFCEIKKFDSEKGGKKNKKSFGVEVEIIAQLMLRKMELTIILTMEL